MPYDRQRAYIYISTMSARHQPYLGRLSIAADNERPTRNYVRVCVVVVVVNVAAQRSSFTILYGSAAQFLGQLVGFSITEAEKGQRAMSYILERCIYILEAKELGHFASLGAISFCLGSLKLDIHSIARLFSRG